MTDLDQPHHQVIRRLRARIFDAWREAIQADDLESTEFAAALEEQAAYYERQAVEPARKCDLCMLPREATYDVDDGRQVCSDHAIELISGDWDGTEHDVKPKSKTWAQVEADRDV